MCGFTGLIRTHPISNDDVAEIINSMTASLTHRGPDDSGIWHNQECSVALGHKRLSIIELSKAGYQPMHSSNDRYVIAFNGEIYNHLAIRQSLEKEFGSLLWNGQSDTETLLAAFEKLGINQTLQKCVGMFAFALWDKKQKILMLGRDRMGEKPLYYGWVNNDFLFGSELKAIKKYPHFNNCISSSALADFLQFSYVPGPQSIYEGIFKVPPGHYIIVEQDKLKNQEVESICYWSLEKVIDRGQKNPINNMQDAILSMETALQDSVGLQMLADVPVGAFLSGGVDSSLISSLMQEQSTLPIKTFTVGFDEHGFDEAPYAQKIANYLKTDHTEIYVNETQARDVIPLLPEIYDEPFADSSQIPTYLISKIAKSKVSVALSGDGADEIFGGYNRYFWAPSIWNKLKVMPLFARQALAKILTIYSQGTIDKFLGQNFIVRPGEKLYKLANSIQHISSIQDLYLNLVRNYSNTNFLLDHHTKNLTPNLSQLLDEALQSNSLSEAHQMMFCDSVSYLPDDILCKVDRASMANSLETRAPFLDHRIVELAWRIPVQMIIKGNQGKLLLKEILYKRIPKELLDRPKSGFGIPLGEWLRLPLRDWAEELLSRDRLILEGNFCPEYTHKIWSEHLSGEFDWSARLWNILMFQAWLENQ